MSGLLGSRLSVQLNSRLNGELSDQPLAYGCTASYLSCGCRGLKTAWPHFAKGVARTEVTEVIGAAAMEAKKRELL